MSFDVDIAIHEAVQGMQSLSETCAGGASSSLRTNVDAFDAVAGVSRVAELMGATIAHLADHLASQQADAQSADTSAAVAAFLARAQTATEDVRAALGEAAKAKPGEDAG